MSERIQGQEESQEDLQDVQSPDEGAVDLSRSDQGGQASPRNPSVKTPKSVATRRRIMRAASDIMVERGSTDFQMSEISARCEMSKGALYYYFSDREELVSAVFTEVIDDAVDALERAVAGVPSSKDALRALYAEIGRLLGAPTPLPLAVMHEFSASVGEQSDYVNERFARGIRTIAEQIGRGQEDGIIRKVLDPTLTAICIVGGFLMASLASTKYGVGGEGDELVEKLYDLAVRGLPAEREEA